MGAKILTAKEARDYPKGNARKEVAVAGCRRLYLVVQPSGARSWAWRAQGIKLTLGSLDDHTYSQALAWGAERNGAHDRGEDQATARETVRKADAALVVADEERKGRTLMWFWRDIYKPAWLTGDKQPELIRLVERHLLPTVGEMPLSDITRADLNAVVKKLALTAPVSANRLVTVCGTILKRAITHHGEEPGLEQSPAQFLAKPFKGERESRKQRVLDRVELGYALAMIENMSNSGTGRGLWAEALKLIVVTGVRRSEAVNAQWSEFDLAKGVWQLPSKRVKNRIAHLIDLPPMILEWLKAKRAAAPKAQYLFAVGEQPISLIGRYQQEMIRATDCLAKRDGRVMGNWGAHSFRRTITTMLAAMSDDDLNPLVPPMVTEAILNHATGVKTELMAVYNKYNYRKERAAALKLWEAVLTEVIGEERDRRRIAIITDDVIDQVGGMWGRSH